MRHSASWFKRPYKPLLDAGVKFYASLLHRRLPGKLSCVLDNVEVEHGHHVMRIYCESLVAGLYEKGSTFLRVEICVNRLKDLGLNKGLANLEALRQTLAVATDRLAGFEAEPLHVHVDFPLFQRLALPVTVGRIRIPGIKIQDTRMMRLMENPAPRARSSPAGGRSTSTPRS